MQRLQKFKAGTSYFPISKILTMKSIAANDDHLYMQVADGIEKMIADDVLKIGDKLPSVRVLSEEYGISMGTAFQAYYHLEGKGLIESRPKSGYYVRFNHQAFSRIATNRCSLKPLSHDVSVKEMIASIYTDIAATDVINFALAVPDTSLLPAAKLNKSVVHALRNIKIIVLIMNIHREILNCENRLQNWHLTGVER